MQWKYWRGSMTDIQRHCLISCGRFLVLNPGTIWKLRGTRGLLVAESDPGPVVSVAFAWAPTHGINIKYCLKKQHQSTREWNISLNMSVTSFFFTKVHKETYVHFQPLMICQARRGSVLSKFNFLDRERFAFECPYCCSGHFTDEDATNPTIRGR